MAMLEIRIKTQLPQFEVLFEVLLLWPWQYTTWKHDSHIYNSQKSKITLKDIIYLLISKHLNMIML